MQKIVELDESIVNKIAAGEVIERPASVVKELVENAIDAEATRIEIDAEDGGRRRIRVFDNGYGMVDADLAMAFKSHSTSKLKKPEDLFHITTMGFRGEALPSIGAVSRAEITSLFRGNSIGAHITMEGGRLGPLMSKGAPAGTCVDVRDLFFNTPVRRKFMRSQASEMRAIVDVVGRIALAHCHVAFLLRHDTQKVFTLEAPHTLAERIAGLVAGSVRDELIPLDYQVQGMSISGYAVRPSLNQATSKGLYIYLNGRFIRDRGITAAIRTAYDGFLITGRYPMAFLFLDVDPAAVDVNVHPTKIEVRFRDGQAVCGGVVRAIRGALEDANLVGSLRVGSQGSTPERPGSEAIRAAVGQYLSRAGSLGRPSPAVLAGRAVEQLSRGAGDGTPWRFMQVHDRYIVVETEAGIRLVDQHALHEKILFTRLVRSSGQVPMQRLLVPVTVELSASAWAGAQEAMEVMRQARFEIEQFGDRTLAVYGVPQILKEADVLPLVRAAVEELGEAEEAGLEEAKRTLWALLACKAAVKAGDRLREDEIVSLLERHAEGDLSDFCPHGRPAVLDLSVEQLDRQFGRT